MNKYIFFNYEDLQGNCICDVHISVLGDYVFYNDVFFGKARNLKTGEEKISGISISDIKVYNDEIYYVANRTVNPENHFFKRSIRNLKERKVTSCRIDEYEFYDNFLYFQKASYASDNDGHENGYIYRTNLETEQTEELIKLRCRGFNVVNNTIYYIRHSNDGYERYSELLCDGIFSYSYADDTERMLVDGWIGDFAMNKDYIAYSEYIPNHSNDKANGRYQLLLLSLDSYEKTKISGDIAVFKLYDDNICYIEKNAPEIINILNSSKGTKTSVVVKDIDIIYGFVLFENKIFYYDKKFDFCEVTIDQL